MSKSRGFSLIELLVVVSIMGMLVSLSMPAFREARRLSRRTACQKNLATIGQGVQAYLQTNRDRFPWVCRLPSQERHRPSADQRPPLFEALATELRGKTEVYRCPADANTLMVGPDAKPTYHESEGLSYEWESRLNGRHLSFKEMPYLPPLPNVLLSRYRMLSDYEPFHGGESMAHSWNTLYADAHVQSN